MSAGSAAEEFRKAFIHARDMDASMEVRLSSFANFVRSNFPASAAVVDRWVERLKQNGAGEGAPKVGDPMPPFVLPDETGRLVSLRELLKQGPVIATFHRGHWCPFCRLSMNTLAKAQARIEHLGAHIVAIVPERHRFAEALRTESSAKFPILTDMDNGYAMSLNLAIWVEAEMEKFMTAGGHRLPEFQGNDAWMLPIPATFVIGTDGRIKARFIDPDHRKRMAVEQLLDALK